MDVDAAAVERARMGGAELDALIGAVWPAAFRVAFGILRDRGLAEDAAQEGCAAIARALPGLKRLDAFRAWSYKVVVSHALALARRRPHAVPLDAIAERQIRFERGDALDLYRALAALTPVQRAAVLLHYYGGLRSGEIAAALGVSPSTVRFHLMLARRSLRKALAVVDPATPPTIEVVTDVH
jgi:RNA polymerase sigma-70 factor, ECF subfamily